MGHKATSNENKYHMAELLEAVLSQNVNANKYGNYRYACDALVLTLLWKPEQVESLMPKYFTNSPESSEFKALLDNPKKREELSETIKIICTKYCKVIEKFRFEDFISNIKNINLDIIPHITHKDFYHLADFFISYEKILNHEIKVTYEISIMSPERYELLMRLLGTKQYTLVIDDFKEGELLHKLLQVLPSSVKVKIPLNHMMMTADKKHQFMDLLKTECNLRVSFEDKLDYQNWPQYDKDLLIETLGMRTSLFVYNKGKKWNKPQNSYIPFTKDLISQCPDLELTISLCGNLLKNSIINQAAESQRVVKKVSDDALKVLKYSPAPEITPEETKEVHKSRISIFQPEKQPNKEDRHERRPCIIL